MPEYTALSNIDHDNSAYATGQNLTLSEEQAAPLIEAGVIKLTSEVDYATDINPEQPERNDGPEDPNAPAPEVTEPEVPADVPASDQQPTGDAPTEPRLDENGNPVTPEVPAEGNPEESAPEGGNGGLLGGLFGKKPAGEQHTITGNEETVA